MTKISSNIYVYATLAIGEERQSDIDLIIVDNDKH